MFPLGYNYLKLSITVVLLPYNEACLQWEWENPSNIEIAEQVYLSSHCFSQPGDNSGKT